MSTDQLQGRPVETTALQRTGAPSAWEVVLRVLVAVALAGGLGSAWLLTAPTTYAATSSLFVKSAPNDAAAVYERGLYEQNRIQTYATLARSSSVLQSALDATGEPMSLSALTDAVTVYVPPQTVAIVVTVEGPEPAVVRDLSTAIAEATAVSANALEQAGSSGTNGVELTVSDSASTPEEPVSPDRVRIAVLCGLLGVLVGLVLPLRRRRRSAPPSWS